MHEHDSGHHSNGLLRQTDMSNVLEMLSGTGMRLGEVLALERNCIDLTRSPVAVAVAVAVAARVSLHADGMVFIQEHGKTGISHRTLMLPAFSTKMLEK